MAQKDRKEKTVPLELTVNQVQKESLESVNQVCPFEFHAVFSAFLICFET